MGNDNLGGSQIGIFQIADDLHGSLLTQLIGVNVYCSQLWCSQFAVKRVIEGNDGNIVGDPKSI